MTYTLFGSYASYYTAKSRSYLRKKNIPFVERLPSAPIFRDKVRPASGSHRIPQLLTPDGQVIQDTVAIQDHLEERFPALPAIPSTPCQRVYVHLMELMASEGLLRLAWQHRWMFDENFAFVKKDFGRSFRPQGSDADLDKYGNLIADRMMSYGLPESTPAARDALDDALLELLGLFECHLIEHPYFLGGHPSAADYAIMGALHAHMGRDPAGLRVMQNHAPRVFRWVENMLVPEVQSPEFHNTPVAYLADDLVPETALALLGFIFREYGQRFLLGALAFNQMLEKDSPEAGKVLDTERDQPHLAAQTIFYGGAQHEHATDVYALWLTQRAQRFYQSLDIPSQQAVLTMLSSSNLKKLVELPLLREIKRINNRFVIA